MSWYLEVLKKYAVFSGRARRKEFWYFTLFNVIIWLVLMILSAAAGRARVIISVLSVLYGLAVIIPGLAVEVRRLHDTGRSGWWILIGLVPFIGAIVLLVFLVQDSQPGANQYGPNPKEMTA